MTRLKRFGKKRSLRLEGVDYKAPYVYHVSFARHRTSTTLLSQQPVADALLEAIGDVARRVRFDVLAYCIMPDHLHILCQPLGEDVTLSTFIGRVKGRASRKLGRRRVNRPLWQRGFYDHILRTEERVWEVARYIAENPVRAGLAPRFEEYPYSYVKGLKDETDVALKGDATED